MPTTTATSLREALERLSTAAMARDNVMGDPCALLAAKAELSDANRAACAALAQPAAEPNRDRADALRLADALEDVWPSSPTTSAATDCAVLDAVVDLLKRWPALAQPQAQPAPAAPRMTVLEAVLRSSPLAMPLAQPAHAPSNQLSGNSGTLSDDDLLRIATTLGLPFGMLDTDYCKSMEIEPGTRTYGEVTCSGMVRFARAVLAARPAPAAPAVPAVQPLQSQLDEARADADRRHQLLGIQHAEAVELWNALKDLSFECDGVTRCIAPSRETYNRTFAVLRRKNHLSPEALRGYGSSGLQQQSVQFADGIAAPGEKP